METIRPRETVILAADHDRLLAWYRDALGFRVTASYEQSYHYYNLETDGGMRIGIGSLKEMTIEAPTPRANAVVLQLEVDDVRKFMKQIEQTDAEIVAGPEFDEEDGFWFGTINDPEGNQIWIVDRNCP